MRQEADRRGSNSAKVDAASLIALRDRILTSVQFTRRDARIGTQILQTLFQASIDGKSRVKRRELAVRCYGIKSDQISTVDTQKVGTAVSRLKGLLKKYFIATAESELIAASIESDKFGSYLVFSKNKTAKIDLETVLWGPYVSSPDPTIIVVLGLPFGLPGDSIGTLREDSALLNSMIGDFFKGMLEFTRVLHERKRLVAVESFDMVWNKPDSKAPMWSQNLLIITRSDEHLRQTPLWSTVNRLAGRSKGSEGVVTSFRGKRSLSPSKPDGKSRQSRYSYAVVTRFRYNNKFVTVMTTAHPTVFRAVMWYMTSPGGLKDLRGYLAPIEEDDHVAEESPVAAWQIIFEVSDARGKIDPGVRPIEGVLFSKGGLLLKWIKDAVLVEDQNEGW